MKSLLARIERIEEAKMRRSVPPLIVGVVEPGETQEAARLRLLKSHGLTALPPGIGLVAFDPEDVQCL